MGVSGEDEAFEAGDEKGSETIGELENFGTTVFPVGHGVLGSCGVDADFGVSGDAATEGVWGTIVEAAESALWWNELGVIGEGSTEGIGNEGGGIDPFGRGTSGLIGSASMMFVIF